MKNEKTLTWTGLAGVFLNIIGVFLPWGTEELTPGVFPAQSYLLGVELLLGTITLVSSVVAAAFLLLHVKGKIKGWRASVLVCMLITLFCTLAWILNPVAVRWYWKWSQEYGLSLINSSGPPYKILFGAYTSLTGSILALIVMILNIVKH